MYLLGYNSAIRQIKATSKFISWLDGLKDVRGRARVQARIQRLASGNPGQYRNLKFAVSELKIDAGPGYRVYFTLRNESLIILLCGGSKAGQAQDIQMAYELVKEFNE